MIYILYRLKFFFARFFNFAGPVHVDIELTNNCNQKCLSCWHNGDRHFELYDMPIEKVYKYIDQAVMAGAVSIKFNLRGEPGVYPRLHDALYYAHGKFVDVMLNTNLTMATNKLLLIAPYVDTFIVSVDSWNFETYKKLHGATQLQFCTMNFNLKTLSEMKESGKFNGRIKLNFHQNIYNMDESYFNIDFFKFETVIKKTMPRRGADISIKENEKKRKAICPHMMRRITITSNGKMYPCCVCYDEPKDIEITNTTIEKAWNSDKRKRIMSDYKKGKYTRTCQNCTSSEI